MTAYGTNRRLTALRSNPQFRVLLQQHTCLPGEGNQHPNERSKTWGAEKSKLAFLRVHTFKMNKPLNLLGYNFDEGQLILESMALDSHENFYRDIKRGA